MQSYPNKASRYCLLTNVLLNFCRFWYVWYGQFVRCSLYNLMTWGSLFEWDCNTLNLHVCCFLTVPESTEQKHREDESCFQWFWGWGLGRNSRIRRNVSIRSTENYNWLYGQITFMNNMKGHLVWFQTKH